MSDSVGSNPKSGSNYQLAGPREDGGGRGEYGEEVSQDEKRKGYKEMEMSNVQATCSWGMEGRDQRSTPKFAGQGLEAKEFKVEAQDSFPTYMRSHRIGSHPALLYNSSSIFGVGPKHLKDSDN